MDDSIKSLYFFSFLLVMVIFGILFVLKKRKEKYYSDPHNKKDLYGDKVDPIAEAEVHLAYGNTKKAINVLEKYLLKYPDDMAVTLLLNKTKNNYGKK